MLDFNYIIQENVKISFKKIDGIHPYAKATGLSAVFYCKCINTFIIPFYDYKRIDLRLSRFYCPALQEDYSEYSSRLSALITLIINS